MEQFRCGQVNLGCDARFRAASAQEVLRQVTVHSWQCHGLHLPHLPAALVREVLEAISGDADSREGSTTLPEEPSLVDVTARDVTAREVTAGDVAQAASGRDARPALSVGPRSAGSWSLGAPH